MFHAFVQDETGLELSEYAVMAALIIAALIGIIIGLRSAIGNKLTSLQDAIAGQTS